MSATPSQLLQYVWIQYIGFGVLDEALIEELASVINTCTVADKVREEISADLKLI